MMSQDIADGFQRGEFKMPPTLAEMVRDGGLGASLAGQPLASMATPLRASLDWLPDFKGLLNRLNQPLMSVDFETLLREARARTQALAHDADEDETVRDAARSTNAILVLTERVVRLERLLSEVLPGVSAEVEAMHGAVVEAMESIGRAKKHANIQAQLNTVWGCLLDGAESLGWFEELTSGVLPFRNSDLVALCMARNLLQKTDDGGEYLDTKHLGTEVTRFFRGKDMGFLPGRQSNEEKNRDFLNACWAAYEGLQKPQGATTIQLRKA